MNKRIFISTLIIFFCSIYISCAYADLPPAKPPPLRNLQPKQEDNEIKNDRKEVSEEETQTNETLFSDDNYRNYPVKKFQDDIIIYNDNLFDISAIDISVIDLLNQVFNKSNKKIIINSNLPQKVSLNVHSITIDELMNYLSISLGFNWSNKDSLYIVSSIDRSYSPNFYPVNYADLEEIKKTLGALGLGNKIVINNYPRGLLVNAPLNENRNIEKIIRQLDIISPSIKVEFVVVEINRNDENKLGITWNDFEGAYSYSKINKESSIITKSLQAGVASLLINSKSTGKILAKPYIITSNNKEAHLSTGDEVPIFSKDYNGNPAVDYKKVGIELYTTPTIVNMEDKILNIKTKAIVNIISGQQTQQGLTAPQISSREAENILNVKSGEIVIIGGLLKEENIQTESGIPLLKKIPLIGNVFKTTSKSKTITDILIFIQPTLINFSSGQLEESTINGFEKFMHRK